MKELVCFRWFYVNMWGNIILNGVCCIKFFWVDEWWMRGCDIEM